MNPSTSPLSSHSPPLKLSSSLLHPRRNHPKPRKTQSFPDQHLSLIIDVGHLKTQTQTSLKTLLNSSKSKLNRLISSGTDALDDFKTLVTVDNHNRVIISCRRSSLWFLANSVIWGFLVFVFWRVVIVKFGLLSRNGGFGFVWRRDRSLGGREVVVGKRKGKEKRVGFRVPMNPLSLTADMMRVESGLVAAPPPRKWGSVEELPEWWPNSLASPSVARDNLEFQREANRVIQAIMDNRMCGKDITEDDILQFRRICKASGAKVYIDTANARDSFYRASVDFVLNFCCSSGSSSSDTQIDGEDAQHFVAGLADSIGLQNVRAARIVSAAVAARTRSWFLQAWALEMQAKRAEALKELSKICLIHRIFPPQDSSAEMEMVARGLGKHLRVEQRKLLLNLLVETCGPPSRSAIEALGLTTTTRSVVEDGTWHLTP